VTLVTGATGLLGAHLVREGLARGQALRVVARTIPRRSFLWSVKEQVDVRASDLCAEVPASLLDGVDTVIHAAASSSPGGEDAEAAAARNVQMVEQLVPAAARAGVRRWVQISSVATVSGGAQPVDERSTTPRDTPYAKAKRAADLLVAARAGVMAVTTLLPTFMLGPFDARPSSGAVFLALRAGVLRHFVDVPKNLVAAADVARGVWAALEAGATGPYLLGGADVPLREFFAEALRLLGLPAGTLEQLSALPAEGAGEGSDARSFAIVRELCTPSEVRSTRAEQAFGYQPTRDPFVALREHVEYLSKARLLRLATPSA